MVRKLVYPLLMFFLLSFASAQAKTNWYIGGAAGGAADSIFNTSSCRDGRISGYGATSWDDAHDNCDTADSSATESNARASCTDAPFWEVNRVYLCFDTSSLSGKTISQAKLKLTATSVIYDLAAALYAVKPTTSVGGIQCPDNTDYVKGQSTDQVASNTVSLASISVNTADDVVFNLDNPNTDINKTGSTEFVIRTSWDYDDSCTQGANPANRAVVGIVMHDHGTAAWWPHLEVWHN